MSHYRKHHSKPSQAANNGAENQSAADPMTHTAAAANEHELLVTLFRELFQSEQSAKLHPLQEADRLGDVPPATALRAVSAHADRVMTELPGLAQKNQLPISAAGLFLGSFLSNFRQLVIDRLVEPERSYRGTLMGMRHGVDLVEFIRYVAQVQNNSELEGWCTSWLAERTPLIDAAAKALEWFARVPAAAIAAPEALKLLAWLRAHLPKIGRPSPGAAPAN